MRCLCLVYLPPRSEIEPSPRRTTRRPLLPISKCRGVHGESRVMQPRLGLHRPLQQRRRRRRWRGGCRREGRRRRRGRREHVPPASRADADGQWGRRRQWRRGGGGGGRAAAHCRSRPAGTSRAPSQCFFLVLRVREWEWDSEKRVLAGFDRRLCCLRLGQPRVKH